MRQKINYLKDNVEKAVKDRQEAILNLALAEPAVSRRELAVTYTKTQHYYGSESTVYRLLKAQDLLEN